jgi:hypothetical protein
MVSDEETETDIEFWWRDEDEGIMCCAAVQKIQLFMRRVIY